MAHSFDTSLSVPQRQLLREAVVARLAPLLKSNGLYLLALAEIPRTIRSGSDEELAMLAHVIGGQWPAVAVAVGKKSYEASGTTGARDRYKSLAILHVYACSNSMRSHMARVAGDVVSAGDTSADPGAETMLEHLEELLIGFQVPSANGSIYQLVPVYEDELDSGDDFIIFEQQYEVQLQRDLKRYKGITQLIAEIRSRHYPDGVSFPKTHATVLAWTLSTLTVQFAAARPADMAVDALIEIATGAGVPRRATIATLVGADAITLESLPKDAAGEVASVPAMGDTVYRVPDGLPTSEQDLP